MGGTPRKDFDARVEVCVSSLVLLDRWGGTTVSPPSLHRQRVVFQALFCWIDGGERLAPTTIQPLPKVSSLVLLDRWGGTVFSPFGSMVCRGVSSLVLLDRWGGTCHLGLERGKSQHVSSLVLLDRWGGTRMVVVAWVHLRVSSLVLLDRWGGNQARKEIKQCA